MVHGGLCPDRALVTPAGDAVIIDFEGLRCFDVEWEHAWPQLRVRDTYPALRPVDLDSARLDLYRNAQTLSLIPGAAQRTYPISARAGGAVRRRGRLARP